MAGAERLELSTVGFGDRCSTIRTMPLQNAELLCHKKLNCKVFLQKNLNIPSFFCKKTVISRFKPSY